MARRGNCSDNAMAENFFSILKTACIYRQKIATFRQAGELIDDFILLQS
ncbi:MAG: IS3 family transposase [Oscillospiraceae bacterium]|nr:IS3 family transposase [Oscillospiraceae bacterium]